VDKVILYAFVSNESYRYRHFRQDYLFCHGEKMFA